MVALVNTVSVGDVSASIQAPIIGDFPEPAPFLRQTRGPTRLIFQKARKKSDMLVRNIIAYALAGDGGRWRAMAGDGARLADRVVGGGSGQAEPAVFFEYGRLRGICDDVNWGIEVVPLMCNTA